MNKLHTFFVLLTPLLYVNTSEVLAAKEVKTDHPLIAAYEGSKIYRKKSKEYDEYELFKGYDKAQKDYISETLEGKITQILYINPTNRSEFEIFKNYQQALNKEGATTIFECNQGNNLQCMDQYVGANLRKKFNINSIVNKSGRYMVSQLQNEDYNAYLVLGVNDKYTDIHVIELREMETDKVSFNLESMHSDIEKKGFVVIQGLYFDTDKTVLKASSKQALELTAQLLKQKSESEFLVVGHTDSEGNLSYNMDLSKGRATAVMSALIDEYNIERARLSAYGVGPLAPIAANTDAQGMAQNRRVVLVQK
ncbi:OmpA family protein [uncultured Paraglaciecola sp.]|uniref:OmpA family protein n=1 Tax=uncultured Paraglaciecola sp. TaxID=1765024 RepID=UPI0030DA075F|tara:strand:- start:51106 stop:52032 length:927 start_codon:yes stop_codon:yes gene_type:complete